MRWRTFGKLQQRETVPLRPDHYDYLYVRRGPWVSPQKRLVAKLRRLFS